MAAGLPTVTTSLANTALGAENLREIIVADTAEEFAQAIVQLLNSAELRRDIGSRGKQFIRETFLWDRAAAILERSLAAVCQTAAEPVTHIAADMNFGHY